MDEKKGIKAVASKHIEAGIAKYQGKIDEHLASLIKGAGLTYTPYIFNDGRIMLVLPNNISAFLYPDKQSLFEFLNLE